MYGYLTVPDPDDAEHKVWAIDEDEAKIVRRIFEMIEVRYGLPRDVPPAQRGRDRRAALRRVLAPDDHGDGPQQRYAGRLIWNRTKNTKVQGEDHHGHEERPESDHVVRHAPELAIIPAV